MAGIGSISLLLLYRKCDVMTCTSCMYTYMYIWIYLTWFLFVFRYINITLELALGGGSSAVGNIQGLRTFRVLRALKTVSIIPGKLKINHFTIFFSFLVSI